MNQVSKRPSPPFRPHRVILHPSENHRLEEVAGIVARIIGALPLEQVRMAVWMAFQNSQAVLIECFLETAEYYLEALRGQGLTVTLEEVK